ncbi:unnamed protein product [Rhizophagus irregularis]|nr:unnamed protein product [Rhizophagus irregularis]
MPASWFWTNQTFVKLYPSGNLLNLFLEHFFHASTRLENKVPVSIPKLLVQDQDLYKTLTCLDRYHNDMADHLLPLNFVPHTVITSFLNNPIGCLKNVSDETYRNAGFLGLNETDFQNRNAGFRNRTNQTFVEGH